jgi:hypothetical protein
VIPHWVIISLSVTRDTGQWFSPGTPVSSTNKTGRHDGLEKRAIYRLVIASRLSSGNKVIVVGWGVHSCGTVTLMIFGQFSDI